jgi:hypothetical protein
VTDARAIAKTREVARPRFEDRMWGSDIEMRCTTKSL